MQDDTGLKRVLTVPSIYVFFQNLVRRQSARKWVMQEVWTLKGGEKVIDVGCGPGDLLEELPFDVDYYGFDISEDYIIRVWTTGDRIGRSAPCTDRPWSATLEALAKLIYRC